VNLNTPKSFLHDNLSEETSNRLGAHDSQSNGRKRHFTRAHLRLTYGKIVLIKAHWRGNIENGIVEKSYKLKP
jgi:hypothetical protein